MTIPKKKTRRAPRPSPSTPRKRAVTKRLIRGKPAPKASSSTTPTQAELRCLRAFRRLREKLGKSPTKRELSEEMGLTESGCQGHLTSLTFKGYLLEEKELVVTGRQLSPLAEELLGLLGG